MNKNLLEPIMLRAWMRRGVLACLLWPLSFLFGLLVNFRFALFVLGYKKTTQLPVPVLVVGNVFLGGTGKTPLVIYLVQQLRAAGWHPAVISRGYLAQQDQAQQAATLEVTSTSSAQAVGDEPLLIAQRCACPVMVGRDRVATAQALLARHPEVNLIISDDGLQHYALQRDVEMLLFDQRGAGNGWLLPAGPLRESAQRRRDFTILTASHDAPAPDLLLKMLPGAAPDASFCMTLQPGEVYALANPAQTCTLTVFVQQSAGQQVLAAAGIGHPDRFFATLRSVGLQFQALPLPDHFAYAADSFSGSQFDQVERILITEKDAVKCRQIEALRQDPRIWVLPVDAQLPSAFLSALLARLQAVQRKEALGNTSVASLTEST